MNINTERVEDPHGKRQVNAQHRLLGQFIGHWHVSGENGGGAPDGTSTHVEGEESYEWMPGSFFVMNRWDRKAGDGSEHCGTGFLGSAHGKFFAQSFDNLGYERRYEVGAQGRVWNYSGEFERARYEFSEDGDSFTAHWELLKNGQEWQTLCHLRGRRVGQPMPAVS